MARPKLSWGPAPGGGVQVATVGWTLRAWPTPGGASPWGWAATEGTRPRDEGGAATEAAARAAAEAVLWGVLYPERRAPVAKGGSTVAGRGLEGALEAQAAADAAAGRCWLWRVPSPPERGADASAQVVDFFGVLADGRAVAIEAKEGAGTSFQIDRIGAKQAAVLAAMDAARGLAGVVIEVRGRRWWVPWGQIAPRVGGGGYVGPDWLGQHGVEMVGADWLGAAEREVGGPDGVLPWGR